MAIVYALHYPYYCESGQGHLQDTSIRTEMFYFMMKVIGTNEFPLICRDHVL